MKQLSLPALFSQMDSRWGLLTLGYNADLQYNIANYGCLITCLSMIARYYGKQVDPSTLNTMLKSVNGFAPYGGDYVWGSLQRAFGDIGETKVNTPTELTDMQINAIKTAIDSGNPVIVQIDYDPKTVALNTHYVVIIGYDNTNENNFTIADPIDGSVKSLQSYLGWYKPSVRKAIEQYAIYTGTPAIQAEGTVAVRIEDNDRNVMKATQFDSLCAYFKLPPIMASTQAILTIVEGLFNQVDKLTKATDQSKSDLLMLANELRTQAKTLSEQVDINSKLKEQVAAQEHKTEAIYATVPVTPPVTTPSTVSYHEAAGTQVDAPKEKTLLSRLLSFFTVTLNDYGKLKDIK